MNKLMQLVYGMGALACLVYAVSTSVNTYTNYKVNEYSQEVEQIKEQAKQQNIIIGQFIEHIKTAKTIDDIKAILKQFNIQ
jgi:archaellum component FlaC